MEKKILLLVLFSLIGLVMGEVASFQTNGISFRRPLPISSTGPRTEKPELPDTIPNVKTIDFSLLTGTTVGYNEYQIKWAFGPYVRWRSLLEYPHDNQIIGANIRWRLSNPVKSDLYLRAHFAKNINNPQNPMKDSDWMTLLPDIHDKLFSYTESESELDMLEIDGGLGFELFDAGNAIFFLELAYLYQSMKYEMYGLEGWQLEYIEYDDRIELDTLHETVVLTYDADFSGLYAAIRPEITIGERVTLGADIKFSPLMKVKDHDDHPLRNKETNAEIKEGTYIAGAFDIRYSHNIGSFDIFADLRVFNEDFSFEGDQTQQYTTTISSATLNPMQS